MAANATNPERVVDKVREQDLDTDKFLYCLSAFLSAFRTISFRLYGVAENRLGKDAKNTREKT